MTLMTQGAQANRTGNLLESTVENAFAERGFTILAFREYEKRGMPRDGDYLVKNVPYTSIYGHKGKTEFLALSAARNLEARIECKWQQVSGSVDEKFPYLFENCKIMPEPLVIVLLDGGGYKPEARRWLRNAAATCTEKNILVLDLTGFLRWANTTL